MVRLPEAVRGARVAGFRQPADRNTQRARAAVKDRDAPNQVSRANSRRRTVISVNTGGSDVARVTAKIRAELGARPLRGGHFSALEDQFQAQGQAARRICMLPGMSLSMIFRMLHSRNRSTVHRSAVLRLTMMGNIALLLVDSPVVVRVTDHASQKIAVAGLKGRAALLVGGTKATVALGADGPIASGDWASTGAIRA